LSDYTPKSTTRENKRTFQKMSEAPQEAPKAKPTEDQKAKKLEQLSLARAAAKAKRKERDERIENLEKRLKEQSEPKVTPREPPKRSVVPVTIEENEEEEEPAPKRPCVVTRQPEVQPQPASPSFFREIQKTVLLGSLGLAAFYINNVYNGTKTVPAVAAPKPVAPAPMGDFPPRIRPQQQLPAVFASQQPTVPVSRSGFFTNKT
jgi:hypothetical protein